MNSDLQRLFKSNNEMNLNRNNDGIGDNSPLAERLLNNNNNQNLDENSIFSNLNRFQYPSKSLNQQPQMQSNKMSNLVNDGLTSRFKWRPTSMNDFGEVKCKATNEIGTTECIYEIKLGGVPNPPTECSHVLKNTSAIISCQVGFHQGDPDIYCYLLRKSDNGVYKEHTRNRESCSFIVNDVNINKLNEFWIYSSNKHGHNKDNGVYLTIGQYIKRKFKFYNFSLEYETILLYYFTAVEQANNQTMMILLGVFGCIAFVILLCCFCFKLRKGFTEGIFY